MRALAWIAVGIFSIVPVHATYGQGVQDECGGAPSRNIRYSSSFESAVNYYYESAKSLSASVTPIDGLPRPFGLDLSGKRQGGSSTTSAQAIEFIQRELSDKRHAIVAECLYSLCKMRSRNDTGGPNALVEAVGGICSQALGTDGAGEARPDDIRPLGGARYVLVENKQAQIEFFLHNPGKGTVALLPPAKSSDNLVSYQGGSGDVSFRPGETKRITVTVRRPTTQEPVTQANIQFPYKSGGGAVRVPFVVMRERLRRCPTGCDYLVRNDFCGQCTFTFGSRIIANTKRDSTEYRCPDMRGTVEIALKTALQILPTCNHPGCAIIDGELRIEQQAKGSRVAVGKIDQTIRSAGGSQPWEPSQSFDLQNRGDILLRIYNNQAVSHPESKEKAAVPGSYGFVGNDNSIIVRWIK